MTAMTASSSHEHSEPSHRPEPLSMRLQKALEERQRQAQQLVEPTPEKSTVSALEAAICEIPLEMGSLRSSWRLGTFSASHTPC